MVARRAVPVAVLVAVVAVVAPTLAGAEGTHDFAKPNVAMGNSNGSGTVPRGVVFSVHEPVTVESLGIEGRFGVATTLSVEVRDVAAPTVVLASGSVAVPAAPVGAAPSWHDVPVTVSFEPGRVYDARFSSSVGWSGSSLRFQTFDNPFFNPSLGHTVGPFLVLDGAWTILNAYSYNNSALWHVHATEAAGDRTAPTIDLTVADGEALGANGWYNAAGSGTDGVTLEVSADDDVALFGVRCTDGTTEIANRPDGEFTLNVGDGHHAVECVARDTSGNSTTSARLTFAVDQTAPTITPVVSPTPVMEGGDATAWPYATDTPSAVADQGCDPVPTTTPGHHTVRCWAVDQAGNETVGSASYDVLYGFAGFFAPVEAMPAVNAARAGSTVPVKFSLDGDRGMDVLAGGAPTVSPCPGASGATTAAAGALRYDADADQYVWLWRTDRAWTGCKLLTVRLTDGSAKAAMFSFR